MRTIPVLVAVCGMSCFGSVMAQAASPCGSTATVLRGDTISSIAERCDVGEAVLLRANPDIESSADLQVGQTLQLQSSGQRTSNQIGSALTSFANRASRSVNDLAGDVGSSVQDLLDKNPDLKSRLDKIGSAIGVTSANQASVSVTPQSGTPGANVTVSATGLPHNTSVSVAFGPTTSSHEVIDQTLTSASGTIEDSVRVPQWAMAGRSFSFTVIGPNNQVMGHSAPFQVNGG